jgi:exodeoxyribonuclease V beta subunit
VNAQGVIERVSDWAELSLEPGGRCLIEASAGTGKTWTISVLYLRLLLEQGLDPTRIVVTTFTEAAASELRERLRGRVSWALNLAERAISPPAASAGAIDGDTASAADPAAAWLHGRWQRGAATPHEDRRRLRLALADLDLAPIGTLHGLCRRILRDYPFECGTAFGVGELVASDALDDELIDDIWRELAQSDGALTAGEQVWFDEGRAELGKTLKQVSGAGIGVREIDPAALTKLMAPEHARMLREWLAGLRFAPRKSALKKAIAELAEFIEAGDPMAALRQTALENLTEPPDAQMADAAQTADLLASDAYAFCRLAAAILVNRDAPEKSAALKALRQRLIEARSQRLIERGQISFDALIERVHDALRGEHGARLAERLHAAWPVTLVDEFQDTDPLQYGILDAIHSDPSGAPRGRLVMIADPKQAIYRFRGGDIQAYLRAMASAEARLHLSVNYRSSSALVEALNAFYQCAGGALSQYDSAIAYEPVSAGPQADARPYTVAGVPCRRPLVLHYYRDPPPSQSERRHAALEACASRIVELLNDPSQRIAGEPVRPGDLAVLLPTHNDIAALRKALAARAVPCVSAGRTSVFATDTARQLHVLLHGIHHAEDEGVVRAALATRLYGLAFSALRALDEDPDDWQTHIRRLHDWRHRWRSDGVLAAVLAIAGHAAGNALTGPDPSAGERVLTDLRHIGELLQAQSAQLAGPEELLTWLDRQRAGDDDEGSDAAEEKQLRIESDASRVVLMTVHASKGLEFPVVFLPLMWAQTARAQAFPIVHEGDRRVLDLGSPQFAQARKQAEKDDQDERFRVLYVALTRARHACHVFCLPPDRRKDGNTEKPATDPDRSALDAMLARLFAAQGRDTLAGLPGIDWREGPWDGAPNRYRAPTDDIAPALSAREPPAAAAPEFRFSFSALTRQSSAAGSEESAAADEIGRDPGPETSAGDAPPHPELQSLEAVRGTRFGNALHGIFEHRRIGVAVAEQLDLVRQSLIDFDVREPRLPIDVLAARLARRIDAALAAELLPGLCLGQLPAQALRAEMDFHFPLADVSMDALRAACEAHGEPDLIPAGSERRLRGLMTGKIDLTLQHDGRFHVLDYKGNWLGASLADYCGPALEQAMDAHHYRFQALLYAVAVDRYLRQRLPDYQRSRHLGECLYVFVRAVGLAPGCGVWARRFDDALIDAVDAALAGRAAGAPA